MGLSCKCGSPVCKRECVAWIDGWPFSATELVKIWGIQRRQVLEHLANGTHPKCADGSIVRRIEDGKRLRPCARRGGFEVWLFDSSGRARAVTGTTEAAAALGAPRASLHRLLRDPGRPIPADWDCVALRTEFGWHFRPY